MKAYQSAKALSLALVMAAGLFASACSAVYTPEPIGSDAPKQALDPKFWDGNWVVEDSLPVAVRVADAKKGDLKIAVISTDDKKSSFTLSVGAAALRQAAGDNLILSTEDMEHPELHRWSLAGMIRPDTGGNRAVLWAINTDTLKEWISAKKLPGHVEDNDIVLDKLTPAQVDQLTSPATGLLRWDSPAILKKLNK